MKTPVCCQPMAVLMVDDDEVDYIALKRAMSHHKLGNILIRAKDGFEALKILTTASTNVPFLVLLDINMPRMNGFELLAQLRSKSILSSLTIFMLTTSDIHEDRFMAAQYDIEGYLVKSDMKKVLGHVIETLQSDKRMTKPPL